MPNIREYSAPQDIGLRPTEVGIDATARAAQKIGSSYDEAASAIRDTGNRAAATIRDVGDVAVKYATHQEVSHGAATFAQIQANLTDKWNQTLKSADPNDTSVAGRFNEEVMQPAIDKFTSSFNTEGGQNFALAQANALRSHMFNKTAGDMSATAGEAVKVNVQQMSNAWTNTAHTDPTSTQHLLDTAESSVDAVISSSPGLTGVAAAQVKGEVLQKVKENIVKAGALGAIANAPDPDKAAATFAERYPEYISGADLQSLTAQAKTVQRAQRVDAIYARTLEDHAKKQASDEREGQYLSQLHSDDPQQSAAVSARAIANDPTLTRVARERMIGIVERETKPEAAAKISNGTATDLISRIRLPDGDPNRITDLNPVYDAYEKGTLSKSDLKFVRDEFTNIRTPEGEALGRRQSQFIDSVKPLIDKSNPLMGKIDQSGHQQIYNFTIDLQKKVAEYRKAGKDPLSLMDPRSPDYMGSPAALSAYQKPLQQSLRDAATAMRQGSVNLTGPGTTITGVQTTDAPVATSVPKPTAAKPPAIGEVRDGYKFLGGSPGAASSWRKMDAT